MHIENVWQKMWKNINFPSHVEKSLEGIFKRSNTRERITIKWKEKKMEIKARRKVRETVRKEILQSLKGILKRSNTRERITIK